MSIKCIVMMSVGYLMVLCASPRPEKGNYAHYYDHVAGDIVWYPVPIFARIKHVRLSEPRKGIFEIHVEMHGKIPIRTKDRFSVAAYFDTPTDYAWDTGVIFALGDYPFTIKPPSPSGGVFLVYKNRWIGKVAAKVQGAFVIMRFESKLVSNSKNLQIVVTRYLPANRNLKRVSGGIGFCVVDVMRLDPRLNNVSIGTPSHP